jgi:DNA invertase Pin-like site-specific DNA recombinase
MRLVGYARQSKTDRSKVPSTEWQAAEIRRWAEQHGHTVNTVRADEDRSGYRRTTRPGFEQLLSDLTDHSVDGVVVWRLDRLSRQGQWGPDVLRFMEARGDKALCSVVEDVDTSTAAGELVLGVRMSMAKGEAEAIASRWRSQKRRWAENGKRHTGGFRPFGLADDRETLDPVESGLIREAAARVLAGESMRGIVLDWNTRTISTSTGGRWTNQGLRQLLLQPRLTGRLVHHDKVIRDDLPAILDDVTAARVAAVLRDPARRPNERVRNHLLSGLVRCGNCGGRLHGKRTTKGVKYGCPSVPQGCGTIIVSAEKAEREVVSRFLEVAAAGIIPPADQPADVMAIAGQLDANQLAREQAAGDHYARLIDRRTYLAVLARLDREDAELRGSAAAAERVRRRVEIPASAKKWANLTVDQKRAVLTAVIDHVVVEPRPDTGVWDPSRLRIEWCS